MEPIQENKGDYYRNKHSHKEEENENLEKSYPEKTTTVYIDGNNLLFVKTSIRTLVLSKKRTEGEQILANLSIRFTQAINDSLNEEKSFKCFLYFDHSNLHTQTAPNFEVISASHLNYKIADDALVDVAKQLNDPENCLFITSDRELQSRLIAENTKVLKPGKFFDFIQETIGDQTFNQILDPQE